jgi:hypothetical protein
MTAAGVAYWTFVQFHGLLVEAGKPRGFVVEHLEHGVQLAITSRSFRRSWC